MGTQFILQSSINFPVALWIEPPPYPFASQGCAAGPFNIYMYKEDNENHTINLYAQGSDSIPYQEPQNKWSHLNPQWMFTDLSGNVITNLTMVSAITTTYNSTTGYLASSQFYYIDDMPSHFCGTRMLWAVADFSQYPVYSDLSDAPQRVPGYANSKVYALAPYIINDMEPSSFNITRDGVNPMFNYYWKNTNIPHVISVIGTSQNGCSGVLKHIPTSNIMGLSAGSIVRDISAISDAYLTWTPDLSNAYLSAYDEHGFVVGGYVRSSVKSNLSGDSVNIYASGMVIYDNIPDQYPYLWISNPDNNTINRIYAPCIPDEWVTHEGTPELFELGQDVIDVSYLQVSSLTDVMSLTGFNGVYGIAIDGEHKEVWCADGESDKVYKFDANGVLLSSLNFGENNTYGYGITGGCTPAGIAIDGLSGAWVTFFDSTSVIRIDMVTGNITDIISLNEESAMGWYLSGDIANFTPVLLVNLSYPLIDADTTEYFAHPADANAYMSYTTDYDDQYVLWNGWQYLQLSNQPLDPLTGGYFTNPAAIPGQQTAYLYRAPVPSISSEYISDPIFKPILAETDYDNNVWITYNNTLCSMLVKYDITVSAIVSTITLPTCSNPMDIHMTRDNDVWVSLTYQAGPPYTRGDVNKYSGIDSHLISSISAFNPNYIALDNSNSLWFTQSGNVLTKVTTAYEIYNWNVGSLPISGINIPGDDGTLIYENILGGVCCDIYDKIWVINSLENTLYTVISGNLTHALEIYPIHSYGWYNDTGTVYNIEHDNLYSAQAFGDWSGSKWIKKYGITEPITKTINISGFSNEFDIYDFGGYDIRRFNESWDASNVIKGFARSSHIRDNYNFWDVYMRALWGDKSTAQGESFGRELYERISNFVANHSDINTCNIAQLYSMAQHTDVPMDDYGMKLPPELKRIMDIGSINQQYLWGARCKCSSNINNNYVEYLSGTEIVVAESYCPECGHYHAGNKGTIFSPLNYIVTAYTPFIIEERSSNKNRYNLIIPPASCQNISVSSVIGDICNTTLSAQTLCVTSYPLSSYYHIVLPDVIEFGPSAIEDDFNEIITYYCFYNYIPMGCNKQIAGVINWDDEYTSLKETASSVDEWYGEGQLLERMISYTLYKGLGLIE
jgi:hypothetical protein